MIQKIDFNKAEFSHDFDCPECKLSIEVDNLLIDKHTEIIKGNCPHCNKELTVKLYRKYKFNVL